MKEIAYSLYATSLLFYASTVNRIVPEPYMVSLASLGVQYSCSKSITTRMKYSTFRKRKRTAEATGRYGTPV